MEKTIKRNITTLMRLAVGYRVNSKRATAFRQWATGVLRDFALRGYLIDKKRMENGVFLDEDYFERLLEEIREIRLSERRAMQRAPMTMEDWANHLDLILQADGNELLQNAGKISAEIAKRHAESEFEKYRVIQDKLFQSDFDIMSHEYESAFRQNFGRTKAKIEYPYDIIP